MEFFKLDTSSLDKLFTSYGIEHGARAENYARITFQSWRSGATSLSGQTMQRLIQLVPPYLNSQTRYSILETIIKSHKKKPQTSIRKYIRINTVDPNPGINEFYSALSEDTVNQPLAHVPDHVMKAANWLYEDDITIVRAMLAKAESEKNELLKNGAIRDFDLILDAIHKQQIKTANYHVSIPTGEISVEVFTPSIGILKRIFG